MDEKTCAIDGCDKPIRARGWCVKHWTRWSRSGDPLATKKNDPDEVSMLAAIGKKPCLVCNLAKPLDDFAKDGRTSDGRVGQCKECSAAAKAPGAKLKNEAFKEWLWELKSQPCTDCHLTWPPYVMQFDHLPQFEKKFNVNVAASTRTTASILAELKKCELVCANCHCIRTQDRRQEG